MVIFFWWSDISTSESSEKSFSDYGIYASGHGLISQLKNQDWRHKYRHLMTTLHLTLMMTTTQLVETSVTNSNSLSEYCALTHMITLDKQCLLCFLTKNWRTTLFLMNMWAINAAMQGNMLWVESVKAAKSKIILYQKWFWRAQILIIIAWKKLLLSIFFIRQGDMNKFRNSQFDSLTCLLFTVVQLMETTLLTLVNYARFVPNSD